VEDWMDKIILKKPGMFTIVSTSLLFPKGEYFHRNYNSVVLAALQK
jgi:hypothetical protein